MWWPCECTPGFLFEICLPLCHGLQELTSRVALQAPGVRQALEVAKQKQQQQKKKKKNKKEGRKKERRCDS